MTTDVDAAAALALWSAFPVDESPRPVVALVGAHIVAPRGGFRDSDTKGAWCDGALEPPPSFPSGPNEADGFPLMSAAAAFDALRAAGDGQGSSTRLNVSEMRLGSADFATDRGPQLLPAWRVSLDGVVSPAAVLAVAPSARFSVPGIVNHSVISGARLGPGDATLTVTFVGGPTAGSNQMEYIASSVESRTAVAIAIGAIDPPRGPRSAVGYAREIAVVLRAPLGNRVLVDARTGAPLAVTT